MRHDSALLVVDGCEWVVSRGGNGLSATCCTPGHILYCAGVLVHRGVWHYAPGSSVVSAWEPLRAGGCVEAILEVMDWARFQR